MKSKKKAVPLFVLIPLIVAITLALAMILIIAFEKDKDTQYVGMCTLKKNGDFRYEGKPLSFAANAFRDVQGVYKMLLLDEDGKNWRAYLLKFTPDYTPYLEEISRTQNILLSGERVESVVTSSPSQTLLRTSSGRLFPIIQGSDDKLAVKNSLGLCGEPWGREAKGSFINDDHLVIWDGKARVAFYQLNLLTGLIPREHPRAPETYLGVESGNSLAPQRCEEAYADTRARIAMAPGYLFYNSSDARSLATYKVSQKGISLNPFDLNDKIESGMVDYRVFREGFWAYRKSGLLDKNEKWILKGMEFDSEINVLSPLSMQSQYQEIHGQIRDQEAAGHWLAEVDRKIFFLRDYYLSLIASVEGRLQRQLFKVEDKTAQESIAAANPWLVMPGNLHLFVKNEKGRVGYSIVECK